MLTPNPANRLHRQHFPSLSLRIKASSATGHPSGGHFGRRSPNSGGQNCTPNNIGESSKRGQLNDGLDTALEQYREHNDVFRDRREQSGSDRRDLFGDLSDQ